MLQLNEAAALLNRPVTSVTRRTVQPAFPAPMLGEAAILWQLSIQPEQGVAVKTGGAIPAYVYIVLLSVFLFGACCILRAVWTFRTAWRPPEPSVLAPKFQATAWVCLMLGAGILLSTGHGLIGTIVLILDVMLPVTRKKKISKAVEDSSDAKPAPAATPAQVDVINH